MYYDILFWETRETAKNQGLEVDTRVTPQEVPAVKNIIWWLRTLAPPWWCWTLEAGQRVVVRLSMRLRAFWAVVSYIALIAHKMIHLFFRHFALTLAWAFSILWCGDRFKLAGVQGAHFPSSHGQKIKTLFLKLSFPSSLVDGEVHLLKNSTPLLNGSGLPFPNCSWGVLLLKWAPAFICARLNSKRKPRNGSLPPFCNSVARCKQITTRAGSWVGAVELKRKIVGIHRHPCRHGEICRSASCGLWWASLALGVHGLDESDIAIPTNGASHLLCTVRAGALSTIRAPQVW